MADTFTTNYNFRKCEVGADNNSWGGHLNGNWDLLDTTMFSNFALKLSLSGGIMTGTLQSLDIVPADNSNRKLGSTTKTYSDIFVQQIDFYNPGSPSTLNGTLSSSGTGFSWKLAGVQAWSFLDVSNNSLFSISSTKAVTVGRVGDPTSPFTVYGTGAFSGLVTASNFSATSDLRLKKDVTEIEDALSLVLALRGVRFKWIEDSAEQLGVIAQEVQDVAPSAVRVNAGKYLSVEYNQLVPLLIEGLRVLAERVTALEGRDH